MGMNCGMEAQMMPTSFNEHIRRILVVGEINDATSAMFLDQITMLEYLDPTTSINVYINSPGGSVSSALAMYDAITTCSCPVRTVSLGLCASAAVLIGASGNKGNRLVSANATVMVHQISTMMMGSSCELDNEVQEVRRLQDVYNKILSKETGRSVKQIQEDMKQNYYMTAQESIKFGIFDKILPTRKVGNVVIPGTKAKKTLRSK